MFIGTLCGETVKVFNGEYGWPHCARFSSVTFTVCDDDSKEFLKHFRF